MRLSWPIKSLTVGSNTVDNPILQIVMQVANDGEQISSVRADFEHGHWTVTVRLAGLRRERRSHCDAVTMTEFNQVKHQCRLPIGTSHEVVETWIREVAEIGNSRDYSRTYDGLRYLTLPTRWGSSYRRQTAELNRTGYLFGDTWHLRARLKQAGLRWAPVRKAWYGPLHTCRQLADRFDLTLWVKPPTCKLIRD